MTHANVAPTVAGIARPDVVALDATASIGDAARTMARRRIGSVAVRDGGEVVGLVTERDLLLKVLVHGADASRPLREAMRPDVPRVAADESEVACAALMRDHATRHLLVEDDGKVVGVVSMRDVIDAMLHEKQYLIDQLATYINGR
ncbi:MAG TPA: CBS domain-containing protein [Anaeromyxobacter sp.]|nr:CBS domain-containing protein [Anaeromyxobacter sp.]